MPWYTGITPVPVDIQIKIFDNSITFFNPGKLFGDLTIEKLKGDDYQSRARNKLIAEAFYLTRDIEKYGSGFIRERWLVAGAYSQCTGKTGSTACSKSCFTHKNHWTVDLSFEKTGPYWLSREQKSGGYFAKDAGWEFDLVTEGALKKNMESGILKEAIRIA